MSQINRYYWDRIVTSTYASFGYVTANDFYIVMTFKRNKGTTNYLYTLHVAKEDSHTTKTNFHASYLDFVNVLWSIDSTDVCCNAATRLSPTHGRSNSQHVHRYQQCG